jgi:osmotically-inducible protein OsmY
MQGSGFRNKIAGPPRDGANQRRLEMKIRIVAMVALAALALAGGAFAQEDAATKALITAENVKALLLEKGGVKTVPIVVTMDGTTAILTGDVATKAVQELASEVALAVDGVKKVDNRLKLVGEKSFSKMSSEEAAKENERELADARLESSGKIALYKAIGTSASKLEIEAADGVVSLRGTLPDAERKKVALDTIGKMKDVKKVVDLVKVGG